MRRKLAQHGSFKTFEAFAELVLYPVYQKVLFIALFIVMIVCRGHKRLGLVRNSESFRT